MKCDLHLHSKHSTRPSQWVLQRLGCAESYAEPSRLYQEAKARGMDLVTIADHNTLDGVLEIAHLPDVFVSVEVTSYFPEDGCKVHVLAHDIDEKAFRDIQKVRENVYELAAHLRRENILHVCAHPLYGVNNRLTVEHVEKILLLFKRLELNGSRDVDSNDAVRRIAAGLTSEILERLSEKHGIEPDYPEPWRKILTGGSDDHGGLNVARMYATAPEAKDKAGFLEALRAGAVHPAGRAAKPETMSHNLYAIGYQFLKKRFDLERRASGDVFLSFVDRFLDNAPPREAGWRDRVARYLGERRYRKAAQADFSDLKGLLRGEAARFILDDPALREIAANGLPLPQDKGQAWFTFVNALSNRIFKAFADHLLNVAGGADLFSVFEALGSGGALYALLAPHFAAYSVFQDGRRMSRAALAALEGKAEAEPIRVGHFTDTFFEINGVARTLQQSLAIAERTGKELTIVTCDPHGRDCGPRVRNFAPIGVYGLPEYPEQKIFYPPLLEMIRYVHEQDFTCLHASTPGPIGLAALLAARILKLPIHATYHTQIPQYAKQLTGDEGMEDLAWKYAVWFYNQMDKVFAPSRDTATELAERGIRPEKILLYPRGVDVRAFHPRKRNGFLKGRQVEDGPNLLYVGRLSREKNLDVLAEAFARLSRDGVKANLILVGDGPHAPALREKLQGTRTVFTGCLEGEELCQCYASCDLFVFPSLTDTFGNVILEAQASGLPVVAGNAGGPKENVAPGETGLILDPLTPESLAEAMAGLLADPGRLRAMGGRARRAMEDRGLERAFEQTWRIYREAS